VRCHNDSADSFEGQMVARCDRSVYDSSGSIHGATDKMGSEVSLRALYGKSAHEMLTWFRTALQTEHSAQQREAVEKCLQALRSLVIGYGYLAGVALMKAHFAYLVRMESQHGHANDGVAIWCGRSAADMQSSYRDAVEEAYGIEQHIRIDECSEALQRVFSRFPEVADIALMLVHFECMAETETDNVSDEGVALASGCPTPVSEARQITCARRVRPESVSGKKGSNLIQRGSCWTGRRLGRPGARKFA
jgi:hypothetical protein